MHLTKEQGKITTMMMTMCVCVCVWLWLWCTFLSSFTYQYHLFFLSTLELAWQFAERLLTLWKEIVS
jgi:hypothetical protein